MAFGPVGKIRANCMKNIQKNSLFGTYNPYKPITFKTVKVKKSLTPKIKWK